MTGLLLLARQHSSTVGHPIKNKMSRPKLRRCSSADDHNTVKVSLGDKEYTKKLSNKSDQTTSDVDSGIEDLDQQLPSSAFQKTTNANEEEIFGAYEEEEEEVEQPIVPEHGLPNRIAHDLILAASVRDGEKKDFCSDTSQVFHGEFGYRLASPFAIKYPGYNYYLFSEEEVLGNPGLWTGFAFLKLDNAKAQFQCPNPKCGRLWTSMRARISFAVSQPQVHGFVVLKICGQNCQTCETPAEALWYMDEVCRVMKNLTQCISMAFNLSIIDSDQTTAPEIVQCVNRNSRRVVYHDSAQRKGKMHAPHNRNHCEACLRGWCFE